MDSAQQTAMPRMNRLLKNSSNTNIRLPPLPVLFPVYAGGQKMVKKGGPAFRRAACLAAYCHLSQKFVVVVVASVVASVVVVGSTSLTRSVMAEP